MKTKFFLFILLAVFYGCSDNKKPLDVDGVSFENLEAAPKHFVSKDKLPTWIVSFIDEFELFTIMEAKIYQGEWNKKTVFLMFNSLQSSLVGQPYYEDGERIEFPEHAALYENFCSTSKNWILIYEFYGKGK